MKLLLLKYVDHLKYFLRHEVARGTLQPSACLYNLRLHLMAYPLTVEHYSENFNDG